MNLAPVLTAGGTAGGTLGLILYMVVIVGVFYFLLIRPQRKQQKEHQALLSTVEIGDSVLTKHFFCF